MWSAYYPDLISLDYDRERCELTISEGGKVMGKFQVSYDAKLDELTISKRALSGQYPETVVSICRFAKEKKVLQEGFVPRLQEWFEVSHSIADVLADMAMVEVFGGEE
jgi:hypothetical protein